MGIFMGELLVSGRVPTWWFFPTHLKKYAKVKLGIISLNSGEIKNVSNHNLATF